ncbi:MAG: cobyrinate a,c-diamide synthase [Desulfovibrionaceae bacterium]|nr:cobyrinate a,c-diamide synthase [Desulfovibrionaceae bacterium]
MPIAHKDNRQSLDYLSLCVAAPRGGGGKTLVSLGLARALTDLGYPVKAFKKGPDYIDAAWLARATGFPATNLDPYLLTKEELKTLYSSALTLRADDRRKKPLFALIEGNRGLFDGVDKEGSCSTAELARTLDVPILLVLNCTKMTRTVAALVLGLTRFEPDISFAGILLNNIGTKRQEKLITEVLSDTCAIPVIGALPRLAHNPLPERHMGIASAGVELACDIELRLDKLSAYLRENCDLALLCMRSKRKQDVRAEQITVTSPRATIGYIRDQAFWFYYEENLEALRRNGATLIPLTLTQAGSNGEDDAWSSLDGLYIGGGFPEDMAWTIANSPKISTIRAMAEDKRPIYAECGGLMLLAESLLVRGARYSMAGIFKAEITFFEKPQGLGYTEGEVLVDTPFYKKGTRIRGHEFHYSRVTKTSERCVLGLKKGLGLGYEQSMDGLCRHAVWASYTHIFAQATPEWAPRFVDLAVTSRRGRQ